jgi:ribonuclease VapC
VIVDSSAFVAIIRGEPDHENHTAALGSVTSPGMSAASALECAIVMGPRREGEVDALIDAAGIIVMPFDAEQLAVARAAHRRYGRRSGSRAQLNFGDCMSYALAKVRGEPLLFKGDAFTHTDIEAAWLP